MKRVAFALLLAAATPALAQEFPYSTFGAELDSGALEGASELTPTPDFLGSIKLAGGTEILLDRTPMSVLTDTFDVAPQTYQHIGYTTVWVCFTHAGRRVWYMADLTYETREDTYVSNVIDEPADPSTDGIFRCKPEPKAMLAQQPALPTVGATLAELNDFYRAQMPEGTHYAVGFRSGDGGFYDYAAKTIYYRLNDGVVDAISVAADYVEP